MPTKPKKAEIRRAKAEPVAEPDPEPMPETEPEPVYEPPKPRQTDSDSILIPGEATHWRAYKVTGESAKGVRLAFGADSSGLEFQEWIVDEFSVRTVRDRWGTGDYRVQWLCKQPGQGTTIQGTAALFRVGPSQGAGMPTHPGAAPDLSGAGDRTRAAYEAGFMPTDKIPFYAPPTGGILAEAFGYSRLYSVMFLEMWQLSRKEAEAEFNRRAEIDKQHHERVMSELEKSHIRAMQLLQQSQRKQLTEARLLQILDARDAEREEEEDDEDDQDDESEAPAADAAAVDPAAPVAPPVDPRTDMLSKITDAGNAIGGAFEKAYALAGEVNKAGATVREILPVVTKAAQGGQGGEAHGGSAE